MITTTTTLNATATTTTTGPILAIDLGKDKSALVTSARR
jgi:hypothetical protein